MVRKGALVLAVIIVLLCALNLTFYFINLSLKNTIANLDNNKEKEFKDRLAKERALIREDLDEKYRADMVSFEAMYKRLEIEKKKMKELQERLKKFENNGQNK